MRLRRDLHGSQKCSIREENQDASALRIGDVNRAAAIHRDSRRMMQAGILKGEQGSALRFKLVDEASAGVSEEIHFPMCRPQMPRAHRACPGLPLCLPMRRGIRRAEAPEVSAPARRAFRKRRRARQRTQRLAGILIATAIGLIGIGISHARNVVSEIDPTHPLGY